MHSDPIQAALKEIIETKQLLSALIRSSESFDYFGAKSVLQELESKVRALGKLQAELSAEPPLSEERRIIPFPGMEARGHRNLPP